MSKKDALMIDKRVFPKGFHAGASRRSMSWIMAMWIHASVVAHKAS